VSELLPGYVLRDEPGLTVFYDRACKQKAHLTPQRTAATPPADRTFPIEFYLPVVRECGYFADEMVKAPLLAGAGAAWLTFFQQIGPAATVLAETLVQRRTVA
jgi:hypothetical protein